MRSDSGGLGRLTGVLSGGLLALVVSCTGGGGGADGGAPKAGDSCTGENTGVCDGDRAELVCQGGTYVVIPCKGPTGCSSNSSQLICDQSGNVAGDACSAADNGTAICSADGTKQLNCTSGTRSAQDCPGGCARSGNTVNCTLVDPNSNWDVVAASATFQTTQPSGDTWDGLGGAPDPELCWYDDIAQAARTCAPEVSDNFSATWTTVLKSNVRASSLMDTASNAVLCLFDVDGASDDQAGCVYARFTAEQIHAGSLTVPLTADANNIGNASFTVRFVQR